MSTKSTTKPKMGRPPGRPNNLSEEALQIFDEFEARYNWRPLADAIELVLRLGNEVKELPDLQLNLPLVQQYHKALSHLLTYRHTQFKPVDNSIESQQTQRAFLELLTETIKSNKKGNKNG